MTDAMSQFITSPEAPAAITTIIGIIASLVVSFIVQYFERRTFRTAREFEEKKYKATILTNACELLNDPKH